MRLNQLQREASCSLRTVVVDVHILIHTQPNYAPGLTGKKTQQPGLLG